MTETGETATSGKMPGVISGALPAGAFKVVVTLYATFDEALHLYDVRGSLAMRLREILGEGAHTDIDSDEVKVLGERRVVDVETERLFIEGNPDGSFDEERDFFSSSVALVAGELEITTIAAVGFGIDLVVPAPPDSDIEGELERRFELAHPDAFGQILTAPLKLQSRAFTVAEENLFHLIELDALGRGEVRDHPTLPANREYPETFLFLSLKSLAPRGPDDEIAASVGTLFERVHNTAAGLVQSWEAALGD